MALFTPTEITDNYAKASIAKAESPAWRLFLLAVAAGVFIGLGAVTSSTAAHALEMPAWCASCRVSSFPSAL